MGATIDFAVSCAPPRGPPKRYGPPEGGVSVYRVTRCAVSMKLVGNPEDPITGPRYAGGLSARGTLRRGFPGLSLRTGTMCCLYVPPLSPHDREYAVAVTLSPRELPDLLPP